MKNPIPAPDTYHEYSAPVSKALYEEYGQIEGTLLERNIQSYGIESEEGFMDEGKVYHHMLIVNSPTPLENLPELFPGVTTSWIHKVQKKSNTLADLPPMTFEYGKDGKLEVRSKDFKFRI